MMGERGNYFAEIEAGRGRGAGARSATPAARCRRACCCRSSAITASPSATCRTCRARPGRSPTCGTGGSTCGRSRWACTRPRAVLLQTLGHFVLGTLDAGRLRRASCAQRIEANYFAAAVLVPEQAAATFLRAAKDARDIVGRGPARRVLGVLRDGRAPVHQPGHPPPRAAVPLRQERRGRHRSTRRTRTTGVVFPADPTGAIEGQRMCRHWSGRQVFTAADRLQPVLPVLRHPVWHLLVHCAGGLRPGTGLCRDPRSSVRGQRAGSAAGTPRSGRTSACPDAAVLPAAAGRARGRAGRAWPGRPRAPTRTCCWRCRPGSFPGVDEADVFEFLDRHAGS